MNREQIHAALEASYKFQQDMTGKDDILALIGLAILEVADALNATSGDQPNDESVAYTLYLLKEEISNH